MHDISHYDDNLRIVKMPFCTINVCCMPRLWVEYNFHLGGGRGQGKGTRAFEAVQVLENRIQYLKVVSAQLR